MIGVYLILVIILSLFAFPISGSKDQLSVGMVFYDPAMGAHCLCV